MFLTVRDLKEKLEEFDENMYVHNEWGDPLIGVDVEAVMIPHKHDEDGDEITILEMCFERWKVRG